MAINYLIDSSSSRQLHPAPLPLVRAASAPAGWACTVRQNDYLVAGVEGCLFISMGKFAVPAMAEDLCLGGNCRSLAAPAAPPPPSKEELLLAEIRDLLKSK